MKRTIEVPVSPAIEIIARALRKECTYSHGDLEEWADLDEWFSRAEAVLAAVTPLILEKAAKVADEHFSPDDTECFAEKIAAAIRALKEQP